MAAHLRQLAAAVAAPEPDDRPRTAPCWAAALIVFSGEGHDLDLAARLRARGVHVEAVDTKAGGSAHDVLHGGVGRDLVARVQRGDFDIVFIATPCASYAVAHRPRLRSRRSPLGIPNAPPEWRRYLEKHNTLGALTAQLIAAADGAGVAWAVENPADRGDRASPAYWSRFADHAPLWKVPAIASAIEQAGGIVATFAQCAFEAPVQKWTSIAHAPCLAEALSGLAQRGCDHGYERHAEQAYGRSADGSSRSEAAAAYPPAMNEFLAEALAGWARGRHDGPPTQRGGAPGGVVGGRVADGHRLSADVARMCEEARHAPPRFASTRNRRAEPVEALRHEPIPGDLRAPQVPSKPPAAVVARRAAAARARLEAAAPPPSVDAARAERMRQGPISIEQLYLDGVYEAEVASWMRLADAATAKLSSGQAAARPPTRVITQQQMQPWARGIVWDCSDPRDCRPVERSDRHTVFRGRRQIDRTALRRIAADLGWHDQDIVDQAGEGGIEVRSYCALDTVLSFHHRGLCDAVAAAAKAVENDWREEWADRPVRHLPFVPCRVLPRNVIMQERSRLVPDPAGGAPRVELYDKPRVTQDSSDGGDDSVNAAVEAHERYVRLPTIQQHARGLAIVDTAGDASSRAMSYVVDAESAYRFCPVQQADLWTQCFIWWGDDGAAGVCVDRRLGFGGAFAPNRFERISTLVAAHVAARQAAFDDTQPTPPSVARWAAERRARQERGELVAGSEQRRPSHRQVYIDDLTGSALTYTVRPPPEVADIVIDPAQVTSEGGVPAHPSSCAYVHAQLAVLGLRDFGLSAAPGKVVVGDPVVGLGFRVSRAARRIDLAPLKRESMLADISKQRAAAAERLRVDRAPAERLVGRCCNISQVFPELKASLHGGYAVTQATWEAGGRRRRLPQLQLASGGVALVEWLALLDVASSLVDANDGVELAPARAFAGRDEPGTLTITTDASGVDGVGGYAFDAGDPGTVWLVSAEWPPDVLAALHAAAAEGDRTAKAAWGMSMPAAELFGTLAVAAAVTEARGWAPSAVVAIGDCDPAAGAINAGTSGNPQMRALLRGSGAAQWLAVSVPREANVDADRLSHPALLAAVRRDAEAAGLAVREAAVTERSWTALRRALALGVGKRRRPADL